MTTFDDFKLTKQLSKAIEELGFEKPTPIQIRSFSVVKSGKDIVGIAQTGTGKTLAYALPLLQGLSYSDQVNPRILVLVPTRELVVQTVDMIETISKYIPCRIKGVFGGTNINTQKDKMAEGMDILVATPGRLFDLVVSGALKLRDVKKLVIDEVDEMLDLGFRYQLTNIFELLPERRQNIMFSATMTEDVDALIHAFFFKPKKISIAVSGTPLENIDQSSYAVLNFNTKANLLKHILKDKETFHKVLVFISTKKQADRLFEEIEEEYGTECGVIHSNKSQNYRLRSVEEFDEGINRILIATDVMARGLDLEKISHVISFDTPVYPENYMHRIGRTGRAKEKGKSILFYTEKEEDAKLAIELLMNMEIPDMDFPKEVEINPQLIPDEKPRIIEKIHRNRKSKLPESGPAFHEKKAKNLKVNLGGPGKRKPSKYKKPKKRGDKKANQKRR